MPFIDTTSIIGGLGQTIPDWALGDDRTFSGATLGLAATDNVLTDAYFTLKSAPNATDANAIVQLHITIALTNSGQITGTPANNLLFNLFSSQIEPFVQAGPVYYWDFRVITSSGRTYTIATGTVAFVQNVTQTNKTGTPAALPNAGIPIFRGFLPTHPKNIPNFFGNFNQGDWYANAQPVPGGPSGWVAIAPGTDSTVFRTSGIVGNT